MAKKAKPAIKPRTARALADSGREFAVADKELRELAPEATEPETVARAAAYVGARKAHAANIARAEEELDLGPVREATGTG